MPASLRRRSRMPIHASSSGFTSASRSRREPEMVGKSASAPPISTCVLCTDSIPRESSIRLLVALRQDRPPPRVRFGSVRSVTVAASRKFLHKAPLAFRAIFTNVLEMYAGGVRFSHAAAAALALEACHERLSLLRGRGPGRSKGRAMILEDRDDSDDTGTLTSHADPDDAARSRVRLEHRATRREHLRLPRAPAI